MINSLLKDEIAKKIFAYKEGKKYAAEIISAVLGLKYEDVIKNLVMIHPNVGVNKNIVDSESDVVYNLNEDYINIEINTIYNERLRIKNNAYLCQLYLRDFKSSNEYLKRKERKVIQINIDGYDYFGYDEFLYKSTMREVKYNVEEKYFMEIYHINLAKLAKESYNEVAVTKDRLKKILYMFICEDKSRLEEMYKGDELMAEIFKVSKELEEHFDELLYYNKEELEKLDREDAINEGREIGLKEGIAEGIKSKALEDAKNMLKKNISIEDISEITGLTKEEIKLLK